MSSRRESKKELNPQTNAFFSLPSKKSFYMKFVEEKKRKNKSFFFAPEAVTSWNETR